METRAASYGLQPFLFALEAPTYQPPACWAEWEHRAGAEVDPLTAYIGKITTNAPQCRYRNRSAPSTASPISEPLRADCLMKGPDFSDERLPRQPKESIILADDSRGDRGWGFGNKH